MTKLKQFVTDNRTWIFGALVTLLVLALVVFGAQRSGKTLWDVLDLIIIPAILAVLAAVFRRIESDRETRREELDRRREATREKLDREFEQDRQREAALQTYLDQMTKLLLDKDRNLCASEPNAAVRAVAQTLTVVTMRRLDGKRNETLLRFLHDARLIKKDKPVIDFERADLSEIDLSRTALREINLRKAYLEGANLEGAYLEGAVLMEAILMEANLEGAFLHRAYLEGANLRGANLRGANLQGANFHKYTTLPNGANWTPDTDMARFTDPTHPDFWRPDA